MTESNRKPPLFLVAPVRTPIGRFGGALAGLTAADLGEGAARACLERAGTGPEAVDQVELNEAFAGQVLACLAELPFDRERVSPDGGAIALGHPIGCTGARILVPLLHGLAAHGGRYGIATLCVSGGMGLAALVETEGR